MANIIDYLIWRGDVPMSVDPFNEVDALVLCQFEYIKLDGIVSANLADKISLQDVHRQYSQVSVEKSEQIISYEQDRKLLRLMAESRRFGNIAVSGYVNIVNNTEDLQFSAVTCFLDDGSLFIVFRGTDGSLVGWKEDMMISYLNQTSSQEQAFNYLSKNFMGLNCPIRIGGHSKGGNLSIFSSMKANKSIQDHIINIYSFDGPGFRDEIVASDEYEKIIPKVKSYIPDGSVVGRLLSSGIEHKLVKNSVTGFMQHLAYNWEIERNHFILTDKPSKSGELLNKTISGWLDNYSDEEREKLVDTVFDVLKGDNVNELKGVKGYANIIKSISKLPHEKQGVLAGALKKIAVSGKGAIFSKESDKPQEKELNWDGTWENSPLGDWGTSK